MQRKLWLRAIAIAAVVVLAPACRTQTATPSQATPTTLQPVHGGKIVYGIETDPNGLHPTRNAWDPAALLVANAIFDTWTAFDASGSAQPYLAKSLSHNPDYTEWTIEIRDGVKFHNGEILDADAGILMVKAIQASLVTGQAAINLGPTEKLSPMSFKITMISPWASFPAILTTQGGYVIAPSQIDSPEGQLQPIGTGPFKVVNWEVGKKVSLTKNHEYWRPGLPYLEAIDFKVEPDGANRVAALKDGTMDVIHASTVSETRQLDALPQPGEISVAHDPGATESVFVMFNTAKPPLNDVRVRRALAYATDRDALAERQLWPKDRLIDGPFAPDSPWYSKVEFPRNDLAQAQKLIQEYEAEHGAGSVSFKLAGPFETGLVQQLSDQWARAGIKTQLEENDVKHSVLVAVTGNYDSDLFRYFAATDPDKVWHFWHSATVKPIGQISLNFSHLADQQVDDALAIGRGTNDFAARKAAYATIQQRFAELVPYIWLYRVDWVIANLAKVHDVKNVTLPDGQIALPYDAGGHRLTETWIEH